MPERQASDTEEGHTKNSLTTVYHLAIVAFKLYCHQRCIYSSDAPCGHHAAKSGHACPTLRGADIVVMPLAGIMLLPSPYSYGYHSTTLCPSWPSSSPLMLQKIHARPIAEVEPVGIQGHPMHPGWNNRRQHLVIERKPTNVLYSYLLRLTIQRHPRIT